MPLWSAYHWQSSRPLATASHNCICEKEGHWTLDLNIVIVRLQTSCYWVVVQSYVYAILFTVWFLSNAKMKCSRNFALLFAIYMGIYIYIYIYRSIYGFIGDEYRHRTFLVGTNPLSGTNSFFGDVPNKFLFFRTHVLLSYALSRRLFVCPQYVLPRHYHKVA